MKKIKHTHHERSLLFDDLPDDIVICILCKLCSTSGCPSDFISIIITCKRLNRLGLQPLVLSQAGPETFSIPAKNWSEHAHRFLKLCVTAGNVEACYTLGMIRFYCQQNRGSGASLMAKAAIKSHAPALYSLAVIHFNGSGGFKEDKNLGVAVELCARAAFLGHADAIRELGHCLRDGYGIRQSIAGGIRLLLQADARQLASQLRSNSNTLSFDSMTWRFLDHPRRDGLFTGDNVKAREMHPVNRFLVEWFGLRNGGLTICSHWACGRPETRMNEFRRCSGCGDVSYCSRACQVHDWKMRHRVECAPLPLEQWIDQGEAI